MSQVDMEKTNTLELLSQAGLPKFDLGADGYPVPGKVVKFYREQMKYVDPTTDKSPFFA